MARRLEWSDVRGGLVACLVLVVAAIAILKYSRVGALRGDTFPLHAAVGDASGLMKGSEVWLSGQKVGKITDIHFRSPRSSDTLHRVAIDMEIQSKYSGAIHTDAVGQIRPGGSFIGPSVVYLTPGTTRGAPIAAGDTVRMREAPDFGRATSQLQSAAQELPAIVGNVTVLRAQLDSTRGTMGAVMHGTALDRVQGIRVRASQLATSLRSRGTAGHVIQGDLTDRARRVMARADSVRSLVGSPNTSLGRFRRDSTLLTNVSDIRAELGRLREEMNSPDGTVGRFSRDSAITLQLAESQRQMTLLFADIKKHPMRYLSF